MCEKRETEEAVAFSLVRQSAWLRLLGMIHARFLALVFVWRRFPLIFNLSSSLFPELITFIGQNVEARVCKTHACVNDNNL